MIIFLSLELDALRISGKQSIKRLQILEAETDQLQTYSGSALPAFADKTVVVYDAVITLAALKKENADVRDFEDVKLMAGVSDGFVMDKRLFTPADRHYYLYDREHPTPSLSGVNVYLLRAVYLRLKGCLTTRCYMREKAAVPAIVDMQISGVPFDYAGWRQSLLPKWEELKALQQQLQTENAREEQKEKEQKLSQYLHTCDTALEQAFFQGRLYSQWDSHASLSGRMTARKPNLQAMPKASRLYFKAEEGYVLAVADYSQIELRVLAEITKDAGLLEIFQNQGDVHTQTAVRLFGKKPEAISDRERRIAKTLNFGIVYGITACGIQKNLMKQQIPLTLEEAEQLRQSFLTLYPGVQKFQQKAAQATKVRSLGGRVFNVSRLRRTQKMNLPVQVSAAEGLKEALAILREQLQNDWKLVAAVHDELILEVPLKDAEAARNALLSAMTQGMERLLKTTPVVAEAVLSPAWGINDNNINDNNTNQKEVYYEI